MLTKQETVGKRHLGGDQQGKGTQENCSAMWLAVSGFMVMGLVSGLSLANHCDSGAVLMVRATLSQDGFWREGFWEVGRTCGLKSPFDLSPVFLVGGSLLVLHSLQGLLL